MTFSSVTARLDRIKRNTPIEGERLTRELATKIMEIAKIKVAPRGTGTGALKKSIKIYSVKKGWRVSAGLGLKRPYAYYQEFGFEPHNVGIKDTGKGKMGSGMLRQKLIKGGFGGAYVSQYFPYMSTAFRKVLKRAPVYLKRTGYRIITK